MTASGAESGPPEGRRRAGGACSRRGRHVVVPDCGHWIPLDAPQAVIDVVTTMVRAIRQTV